MGHDLWVNNQRIGFSQSKKNAKYVIEDDFPVAQKVEISQKRRNQLSKARPKNQLMPPKDVRCSRRLAYFMKAKVEEVKERSNDILDESKEKGMASLTITNCEQDQEKNQGQGPNCPPGFSDCPPLPAYNTRARNNIEGVSEVEDDQVKTPASVKVFQDIIDNWGKEYDVGREYAMGPWF